MNDDEMVRIKVRGIERKFPDFVQWRWQFLLLRDVGVYGDIKGFYVSNKLRLIFRVIKAYTSELEVKIAEARLRAEGIVDVTLILPYSVWKLIAMVYEWKKPIQKKELEQLDTLEKINEFVALRTLLYEAGEVK
jgi:hypothetical protein